MNMYFGTIVTRGFSLKFNMNLTKIFSIVTFLCAVSINEINATYVTFDFFSNNECKISAYFDNESKTMKTTMVNNIIEYHEKLSSVTNGKLTVDSVTLHNNDLEFNNIKSHNNNNDTVKIFIRGRNGFNSRVKFALNEIVYFPEITGTDLQLMVGSDNMKLNCVIESYYKLNDEYQLKWCILKNNNPSSIKVFKVFWDFFRLGALTTDNLDEYNVNDGTKHILLRK